MDLRNYYKKTPSLDIHDEIFKSTNSYQYYLFGMAYGLYSIYETMNHLKDEKFTNEEVKIIIEGAMSRPDAEKLKYYFDKLIGD